MLECDMEQEQFTFESLIAAAETIVAVEILSTDDSATPKDGAMVATARVLKALKGPYTTGMQFSFKETAWGYQSAEGPLRPRENTVSSSLDLASTSATKQESIPVPR